MDFSQFQSTTVVNSKKDVRQSKTKNLSSSIRTTEEQPKVKPKLEVKGVDYSVYKKVYQYCEGCDTPTVQYLSSVCATCLYCKHQTPFVQYQSKALPKAQNIQNFNSFIWL